MDITALNIQKLSIVKIVWINQLQPTWYISSRNIDNDYDKRQYHRTIKFYTATLIWVIILVADVSFYTFVLFYCSYIFSYRMRDFITDINNSKRMCRLTRHTLWIITFVHKMVMLSDKISKIDKFNIDFDSISKRRQVL